MLEVAKVNKRLVVRDADSGEHVYSMPSFLAPVRDRAAMAELATRLEAGEGIQAIAEFETAHNRRVSATKAKR